MQAPAENPSSSPATPALAIFASLQREWERLATAPTAIAEAAQWESAEPLLLGGGPRAVLSRVAWAGYRPSPEGAAVLAALLRQAVRPFAALTLLQALLPRIRAERVHTPTYGHGVGETWPTPADTLADLVAECFAAIRRHAGEDRADADRVIVGEGARRLRTARQAQHRYQCRTASLLEGDWGGAAGDLSSALTDAEWLAAALVEAVREGRLGAAQARLLYATRVKGLPASEVARSVGIPPGAIYYALSTAERSLLSPASRTSKGHPSCRSGGDGAAAGRRTLTKRPAA